MASCATTEALTHYLPAQQHGNANRRRLVSTLTSNHMVMVVRERYMIERNDMPLTYPDRGTTLQEFGVDIHAPPPHLELRATK